MLRPATLQLTGVAIALGWFQVAAVIRLMRSARLDVLDSEYVMLARGKGGVACRMNC
ncbi:MAG: hypothetical protein HYZ81_19050, partial [Nitrospinae bacterium]|nr:hypothetical protein [Nitrospinota bacterium]